MILANIKSKLTHIQNALLRAPAHFDPEAIKILNGHNAGIIKRLRNIIEKNDESALVAAFESFLAENWNFVQGTALCYTAHPTSPITDLLCDVAAYVAEEKNKLIPENEAQISTIQILMPTVACDSMFPHQYPNLDSHIDIKAILKTYIVGREGKYLIPVKCINSEEFVDGKPIVNPYYDVFSHPEDMAFLTENEIQRLGVHSQFTKELCAAKEALEGLSGNQDNLLGRLRTLSIHLRFNSVDGIGQETIAGMGSSLAIFQFKEYYDKLTFEEKSRIPPAITGEIALLLHHASYETSYTGRNTDYGSCLASRRGSLERAMKHQETLLCSIGLTDSSNLETLITDAKSRLNAARENVLTENGQNPNDEGFDKLGIPLRLARHFNFKLKNLDMLKHLSDAEFKEYCRDPDYKKSIIRAIGSLENLFDLVEKLSASKFKILLTELRSELTRTYLVSGLNFVDSLMKFKSDKLTFYLKEFHEVLPDLISSCDDLKMLLLVMNEDEQTAFYNRTKPHLLEKIKSIWELPGFLVALKYHPSASDLFDAFIARELATVDEEELAITKEELGILYQYMRESSAFLPNVWEFYFDYIIQYMQIAAIPSAKKYLWSPFESPSAFFKGLKVPFIGYGFVLSVSIATVQYAINALYELLNGKFLDGAMSLSMAAGGLALAGTLTLISTAWAFLMAAGLVVRSIHTLGSLLIGNNSEDTNLEIHESPTFSP